MEVFDKHLNYQITTRDKDNDITNVPYWNQLSIDEHDYNFDEEFKKVISDDGVPEFDDNNASDAPEIFDSYINMDVGAPRRNDGELYYKTVRRLEIDDDGKLLELETSKPITEKRLYEVDYIYGTVKPLATNVIAENLLSQVDQEGHYQLFIDEIIDHRKTPGYVK